MHIFKNLYCLRWAGLWLPLFLSLCLGCADGEQEKVTAGQEVITKALTAWKSGAKPDSLKSGDPSLEFYDDDWSRFAKLLDFKIEESYLDAGVKTARCYVTLTIKYPNKTPREVKCVYQIITDPRLMVSRDPMS